MALICLSTVGVFLSPPYKPASGNELQLIEKLLGDLRNKDIDTKVRAAERLGQMGRQAAPAVAAIIDDMANLASASILDPAFYAYTIEGDALVSIGAPAVRQLVLALETNRLPSAASILGRIGPPAKEAIPALIAQLGCRHTETDRITVIEAIASIGAPTEASQIALINRLKQADTWMERRAVVDAMAKPSPPIAPFLDSLREAAARDSIFAVRFAAAEALCQMDPSFTAVVVIDSNATKLGLKPIESNPARSTVISKLAIKPTDNDPTRSPFANGKPSTLQYNTAAIPVLIHILSTNPSTDIQIAVMQDLGEFGPNAAQAVPTMTKILLSERDDTLRITAIATIGNIGPRLNQSDTVTALVSALKSDNPVLRRYAATALSRINAPLYIDIKKR